MIKRALSLLVIGWCLGFALFAVALPGPAGAARTDGIVVLTGGPGRIPRGLALLEARRAKRLLISGVDRTVRPHELALEVDAPSALFDCCVDLGREAVDTRSNGDETARWVRRLGYRSVRLVTTDYHMRRARFELATALGPEVAIVTDAVASEQALGSLVTEYNKYLLRRLSVGIGL